MAKLYMDRSDFEELIRDFTQFATEYLQTQSEMPAASSEAASASIIQSDIGQGVGAFQALSDFKSKFSQYMSGSTGPNYFGFVTGGATPAGLIGDWMTALFDQNAMGSSDSIAPAIELQAVRMFCELIGLSKSYSGSFVTGATMSSFVGLSTARQWIGTKWGLDVAQSGLHQLPRMKILSGTPHSSIYKGASMCGLGRDSLVQVSTLPNREAVDVLQLEEMLSISDQPVIVVANSGTVNTVDFDDLAAIAKLKQKYDFWLHVDAAFGGVAACSKFYAHYLNGLDQADSITIDAHKWLNVPYDCAIQLTKHLELQRAVFQNSASYLSNEISETNYVDLTPENSRRLRALPVWLTLTAYGKNGYAGMIERNVECAKEFGRLIDADERFELLAPVTLNGVCFALSKNSGDLNQRTRRLLDDLRSDSTFFLTGTAYQGKPALRLSVTNWQTEIKHIQACHKKIRDLVNV